MDNPFNHNQLCERFLYDYFIDKGFYETAEVFRQETQARAYPLSPSEIDVPNEHLLEWWVVNSDFSEWESKNSLNNEDSWYKAEVTMSQQSGLTLSREDALNEQMIEELTLDNSFGVILGFGDNLVHETAPNPGSVIPFSASANQGYSDNEGLESVVQAYLRTTTVESNEACLSVPNSESLISLSAPANQDDTHNKELDFVVQAFPSTTMIASKEVGLAVPNPGNLMPSFPLVNHGGTDNQGLESIVEAFVRPRNASNESQSVGMRKRSRNYENGSIDKPGTNNSHLETSSRFGDSEHLFESSSCRIKIEEYGMGALFSQDNSFNLPTYLVEEKNDEEGNFCSKGVTLKLSSSLMEEKKEDANFVEGDTFELSSIVKRKKIEEGGSSSRDAYVYDSSHDKGNEDDGVISAINLDELHEAPNNDERRGVTAGGTSVLQTMPHSESLAWSSAPANLNGTDTLGPHSAVQAIVNTTEITSTEIGGKRMKSVDSEDETVYVLGGNNSYSETSVPVYSEKLTEFPFCCPKHGGASSSKDDKCNPSSLVEEEKYDEENFSCKNDKLNPFTSLVKEENYEEGNFSGEDENYKLSSSFMEEEKDDTGVFTTKLDSFDLVIYVDKGWKRGRRFL